MKVFVNDRPIEFDTTSIAYFREHGALGAHIRSHTPHIGPENDDMLLLIRKGQPDLVVRDSDPIEIEDGMSFLTVPRASWGG